MTSLSKRRIQTLGLGLLLALQASRACSDSGLLDALRSDALVLDQASKALLAPAYAGPDGFTVYVGSNAKSVWLREIWLGIDNKPLTRYVYSQREAEALAAHGLHQLLVADLAPGRHRLRAQAAAAPLDAGPSDPRQRAAIDLEFEKTVGPIQFELSWTEASFAGQPTLKLREWRGLSSPSQDAGLTALAGGDGPGARAADFLDATGHRFMAAAQRQLLGINAPAVTSPAGAGVPVSAADDNSAALYEAYNALAGQAATGDHLLALEALANSEECRNSPRLLCDRLNAALGYRRLASRDGLAAAAAFRRVRDPGPYANSALLGLGWALLAPPTADAAAKDDAATAGPQRREVRSMQPKELAEALRAAMVPWIELTGRDPTDPAVQEGQIALPWALSQLNAQVQAQDYYNRAVTQLDAIIQRADKAAAEVSAGKLRATILNLPAGEAWHWGLADLLPDSRWWLYPPDAVRETFYLEPLLGNKPFRDAAEHLQELQEIDATLAINEQGLSASGNADLLARTQRLRARLAALRDAECHQLEVLAAESLQGLKRQTQAYLVEARYALAQLYDRAPELASR